MTEMQQFGLELLIGGMVILVVAALLDSKIRAMKRFRRK